MIFMPKKKIIHIISSLDSGGCENMLLRTLPLLLDEFEHRIITLRELGELAPQFAEKGIPVTTIHWGWVFDFPGYRRLLSETRRCAPDVVITYLFHADMIGRLFLRPALSLRAKHGDLVPIIPFLRTTYNHPKYLIARLLEKVTKGLVSCYLANSEAVKNFYVSEVGVPAEKITVIPNGIDTDFFDNIQPDPMLRKALGITPDDFVIICVANLHPNKGHCYLLQAFEAVYKKHPETYLLIVGDGVECDPLKNQMHGYASKNNISFLGRRTDVPELLKISNLFVLPTLFEGQSNALMEAMACGLPIITTDIPENCELICNEKTGLLIPPHNSYTIAIAIENLLCDKKKSLEIGTNAKLHIRQQFNVRITKSKLDQFFKIL